MSPRSSTSMSTWTIRRIKERVEVFDSWYENPLDLPGRWYLQAIRELFKENRLAKGEFVGLELSTSKSFMSSVADFQSVSATWPTPLPSSVSTRLWPL